MYHILLWTNNLYTKRQLTGTSYTHENESTEMWSHDIIISIQGSEIHTCG